MKLKAVVTDLNSIDEAHRPLYVQDGDIYKLDIEPVQGYELDNVTGLKNALASERSITAGLNSKLKVFEGIDPTSARQAMARLAEFGDLDPEKAKAGLQAIEKYTSFDPEKEADKIAEGKFKNAKSQLQADFLNEKTALTSELTSTKGEVERLRAQMEKTLKSKVIADELNAARPIDEARDLLEQMAGNVVKLQEIEGEYRAVVVDGNGQPRLKLAADYTSVPFTVADLMAEMREKRAALFRPDDKQGLGTEKSRETSASTKVAGFDGPNPFAKASLNVTQQWQLMKRDPQLAARLRQEAGA